MAGCALLIATWLVCLAYIRRSDREWEPLAQKIVRDAGEPTAVRRGGDRFSRAGARAAGPETDPMTVIAAVNEFALSVFALVLAGTLGITFWASRRQRTAAEFWAAGRGITGVQNGFAMAGDYLSASTFLGFAGLIFFYGLDGFVGLVAAGVGFVPLFLLLAERMRNAGKFTGADVLALRLASARRAWRRPWPRSACRPSTSSRRWSAPGVLLQALVGIDFLVCVAAHGHVHDDLRHLRRHACHHVGADHQGGPAHERRHGPHRARARPRSASTPSSCSTAPWPSTREGEAFLTSGLQHPNSINAISFGLALLLGTAGLPHLLMRFFTVPDAKAARSSVNWAVFLIATFFIMTMFVGVGARAILGAGAEEASAGGNLATPLLAQELGGGVGHGRRRPVPGRHQRRRLRDDPRGGGRPRDRLLGRGGARPVVQRRPPRARPRRTRR